jgi:hypothetical protein
LLFIPMWAANPLFWSGLAHLYTGQYRAARNAGLAALFLSLSQSWMVYRELRVGYFAWVGSMVLLTAAGWCGQLRCCPIHGSCGACEATRIAARFASRPPYLNSASLVPDAFTLPLSPAPPHGCCGSSGQWWGRAPGY